jgi:hypothetical protein
VFERSFAEDAIDEVKIFAHESLSGVRSGAE